MITMYDSVSVGSLPAGAAAYAGYTDGAYANASAIQARFPHATVLTISVYAGGPGSALDVEPYDATDSQAATKWYSVYYASVSNAEALVNMLAAHGIARSSYKLWTAHYTGVEHLCGAGCGYPAVHADGTQYASNNSFDTSLLADDFFGAVRPEDTVLNSGATGSAVTALQQRLNAWGAKLVVDSDFGPATLAAVKAFQSNHGLAVDGVVGPATWAQLDATPAPAGKWAYSAPQGLTVRGGRTSALFAWHVPALNGHPAPKSYTVRVYDASGHMVTQRTANGLSLQIGSLSPGAHTAYVWANGGPSAPAGTPTISFKVG
jgi:hypothetical protein